jgi:hypothetical protein
VNLFTIKASNLTNYKVPCYTIFSKHCSLNLQFSFRMTGQDSHPYKTSYSNTMQHNNHEKGGQLLTKHSYNIFSELPLPTINHLASLRTVVHDASNPRDVSYVV